MKIFYHLDADGKCAAYWVKECARNRKPELPMEFIPINYGLEFPFNKIQKDEPVYIVDFSIEVWQMEKLLTITQDITWIDHHKTAIEKYADFPYEIRGIRKDGIAGCMLTYCYLNHMTQFGSGDIKEFNNKMTEDAPMFTKLIADYDVWTFRYGDATRKFHIAFNSEEITPTSNHWNRFKMDMKKYFAKGETMIKYRDNYAKEYMKSFGFEREFEGYAAFVANIGLAGSDWFSSVDDNLYDLYISVVYDGCKWKYSLRSSKIDVSLLAKRYGGGGHKGASGFAWNTFLF